MPAPLLTKHNSLCINLAYPVPPSYSAQAIKHSSVCFNLICPVPLCPPAQVIYAIKTRNGQVYLRLKRNFGDMSALEVRCARCACCACCAH